MSNEKMTAEEMVKTGVSFDRILTMAYNDPDFNFMNCTAKMTVIKKDVEYEMKYSLIDSLDEYSETFVVADETDKRWMRNAVKRPQNLYAACIQTQPGDKRTFLFVYHKGSTTDAVYKLCVSIVNEYMKFKDIYTKREMEEAVVKFETDARNIQQLRTHTSDSKLYDELIGSL